MSIGIIVLAAGEAKRFGSAKLVMPIDGVPLVRRAVLAALGTGAQVVVVTGAHRAAVDACITDLAAARVFNANWADGMGGSIACGIAALRSCDATVIALADQALVGSGEFAALIAAHEHAPERIIAAQFDGVLGPPCLFPRRHFAELAALRGETGARILLRRHAADVEPLALPAAATDIDTPADYARAAGQRQTSSL